MTQRKPPHMTFPDWVDTQIRTAEEQGAFKDLPGKGKPIPDLGRSQDDMAWIVDKLRRENVDIAGVLPPALALAKEVEVLPERLLRERSEVRVRELLEDLNQRIRHARRAPQVGPPLRVRTVDVDAHIAQWQAAVDARRPTTPPEVVTPAPPVRPRRWFRRR